MEETLIINQNEEENPGKPVRRPGASPEGPGKAGIGQRRGCLAVFMTRLARAGIGHQ